MQKILLVLTLVALASSCSKTTPAATCSWVSGTLSGNSYQISKIMQGSLDITIQTKASNTCFENILKLNTDGSVTESKATGCSVGTVVPATWGSTAVGSGRQFILGAKTYNVGNYDCNFFETQDVIGSANVVLTWTKQ